MQASAPQQYHTNNSLPHPNQAPQGNHAQQYSNNKPQPPLPSGGGQYGNQPSGQPGRRLSPQSQPPTNYNCVSSPPPSYGFQSPPPVNYGNRPPSAQSGSHQSPRLSPSPVPSTNADPALWPLFKAVDKSGRHPNHSPILYTTKLTNPQAVGNSQSASSVPPSSTATGPRSTRTRSR